AADTVGEFAGIARAPGFRLPGAPILPRVRLIGRRWELVNSIRCDSRAKDLRENIKDDFGLRQALGTILGDLAFRRGVGGNWLETYVPDIETVVRVAQQLAGRNNPLLAFSVTSWHSSLEKMGRPVPGPDPRAGLSEEALRRPS